MILYRTTPMLFEILKSNTKFRMYADERNIKVVEKNTHYYVKGVRTMTKASLPPIERTLTCFLFGVLIRIQTINDRLFEIFPIQRSINFQIFQLYF